MYKKYLSLDVGDVRIGVAKSDIMGMIATPLEVIDRKKTKAVKRIKALCTEYETKTIVIGIPISLDGTEKRQAEKVREFMAKLVKKIPELEFIEIDERLSTVSADKMLQANGVKGAINKR
ncbi:MAG: Holliday junction resolvase RuvX, partial [Psychrilyobacter sp.]|nr:Holliday junction resolvase RuvX [Psychrilyobacter sp.]